MKMVKFNSISKLAEAYQKQYNASYNNDPQKSFSVQNVIDVCVKTTTAGYARNYMKLDVSTVALKVKYIPDFGYAEIC